jgi:hypothetical protein
MFSTIILSALAMIPSAYAQSSQPLQAKVPFAFSAQNMTLPAGSYELTYSNTAHTLWIRGLDPDSKGAFVTALPADASEASGTSGKLVFRCYGQSCYLAQVWRDGIASRGLMVRKSEPERVLSFSVRAVTVAIPANSRPRGWF